MWRRSELEAVSCSNCGDSETRLVCRRPDGLCVVECLRCGLAYVSPRPNGSALRQLYGQRYFVKDSGAGNAVGYSDYARTPAVNGAFTPLNLLEGLRKLDGARVLEVGCATADVLAEVRRRGAEVAGLDVSQWAAEIAGRRHGIEVLVGTLDSLGPKLGTFDFVLALEVIEHVEDPKAFLRQLAGHLAQGGYAMISTPNYRCARRFGGRWAGFQKSFEHLYFLSDEVLGRMAAAAGLDELVWYTIGHGLAPEHSSRNAVAKVRCLAKRIPGAARVWNLARNLATGGRYEIHGQGHTLVSIFQKSEQPSPAELASDRNMAVQPSAENQREAVPGAARRPVALLQRQASFRQAVLPGQRNAANAKPDPVPIPSGRAGSRAERHRREEQP